MKYHYQNFILFINYSGQNQLGIMTLVNLGTYINGMLHPGMKKSQIYLSIQKMYQ